MKKLLFIFLFSIAASIGRSNNDTLFVYYLENYPYSYTENKQIKGIEIEILNEFINWVKNDGMFFTVIYKSFDEFDKFYSAVKTAGPKVVGLGSVTINEERLKDVSFSPPYIKNVSILISNGNTKTLKDKKEITKEFKDEIAVTIKNSVYEKYLLNIKKQYMPALKIEYAENEFDAIEKVANTNYYFAYCDILSYWTYLQKHSNQFLKIQKVFTVDKDNLGLITQKNFKYKAMLSEFFETGFGFIATKRYTEILEKYLSFEVIESVKVN